MEDYSKFLGAKFFIEEGNSFKVVRVISFSNIDTARVLDEKTNKTYKIPFKTLINDYNILNPDGYIIFSIVSLNDNIQDVIVSLFRIDDMNLSMPYCVCRQNIYDIHNNVILKSDKDFMVGCCMSVETIPDGIDYRVMTSCNSLDFFTMVAVYNTDKLDDILTCVKKIARYDEVLKKLYDDNISRIQIPIIKEKALKQRIYMGYCQTVKELLINNEFMYDFRRAFGIAQMDNITIEDNLIPSDIDNSIAFLNSDAMAIIEKEYGFKLNNHFVMPFDKDVNLKGILRDKILICDRNEKIYLIVYDRNNNVKLNPINPIDKLQNIIDATNK